MITMISYFTWEIQETGRPVQVNIEHALYPTLFTYLVADLSLTSIADETCVALASISASVET